VIAGFESSTITTLPLIASTPSPRPSQENYLRGVIFVQYFGAEAAPWRSRCRKRGGIFDDKVSGSNRKKQKEKGESKNRMVLESSVFCSREAVAAARMASCNQFSAMNGRASRSEWGVGEGEGPS
jgi:hypothetical protein